ncbi:hypothetical protein MCOR34_002729 [Pyricularia oryzae]|nr:hypothetical protein MCOR34_002729 [Pyricularia oryzae]
MATCLLGGTKTTPSKTLEEQCMSWRINISTSPRQPQKKLEIPLAGSRWMWLGLPSRLHPLCLSRAFHPYVREQDRKRGAQPPGAAATVLYSALHSASEGSWPAPQSCTVHRTTG